MAYNVFNEVLENEMNSIGLKPKKPKVVYSKKKQTGERLDFDADKKRKALPPGKRISKNGKPYYESRRNRTDIPGLGI